MGCNIWLTYLCHHCSNGWVLHRIKYCWMKRKARCPIGISLRSLVSVEKQNDIKELRPKSHCFHEKLYENNGKYSNSLLWKWHRLKRTFKCLEETMNFNQHKLFHPDRQFKRISTNIWDCFFGKIFPFSLSAATNSFCASFKYFRAHFFLFYREFFLWTTEMVTVWAKMQWKNVDDDGYNQIVRFISHSPNNGCVVFHLSNSIISCV